MDSLLAEMERKRKQLESNTVTAKKKYFKRGELSKQQTEEYHKKKEEKLKSKGLLPNEEKGNEEDYIKNLIKPKSDKSDKYKEVPTSELVRRFREKGEPISLFGETHEEACQRLRLVEMMAKEDNKGLRNDFKAAMDRVDQAYMDQLVGENSAENAQKAHDVRLATDIVSLEEINELAQKLNRGDMSLDSKVVLEFLRHISHLWGMDLNNRQLDEKMTLQGRLNSAQYEQTMSYLKPLFRKLRSVSLSKDILNALTTIVDKLMEREYVKANDKYLQMAIGNAPWPIGVTNPGIHARTGREKISTSLVAHVLNDETQRKYIQALKRLMTYSQKRFPTDPSKCVEYNGVNT